MKAISQDYLFSTFVNDCNDPNEFIIEFVLCDAVGKTAVKVTNNFDELIEFLEELS
ncbi:hypothetical protein [Neobacillus kokaensis]|uniref:Uncharacterized protein n=1 Tax=Neobacillus kokaensis TaxID=2759023 RepID=A0ABQ3NAE0_9BACI|nr:hypothetical protein [Neobacillus kokaensis]GHH99101.1 hypothetical protein AM1BK_26440 [Neobacillus kokaensis]